MGFRLLIEVTLAIALAAGVAVAGDLTLAARRVADLELARSGYVLKSRSFSPAARARALKLVTKLEARAGSLSNAEFLLGMMKLTALAGNGHDSLDPGPGAWEPGTRLPLRLLWFPDALVVARAAPEESDLLGARVLRIESLAPRELLARLRPLSGGTDRYRMWDLLWVIENGGMLHALRAAHDESRLHFGLRLRDGRLIERTIAFVPKSRLPEGADPVRYLSPAHINDESRLGWRSAIDPARAPLYLQDADTLFRAVPLPSLHATYVEFRANRDEGHQHLVPFATSLLARIRKDRPRNVILDLRFDVGGNIDLTQALLREIARDATGRIYVLVGRYTFSAGIAAAAIVKHDGGGHVTIVGEEMADPLRWWSEIDTTCLPNTHLCLNGTHGLWDLAHGCRAEPFCYSDRFNAVVGSLRPDIAAPLTAGAWLAKRDPGLEAVKTDLARRRSSRADAQKRE